MTTYPPPLHEPVLRLLENQLAGLIQSHQPSGQVIEEAYLQQRLGLKLQQEPRVSADLALFQQHFVLYHLLYRLQQSWLPGSGYLHIMLAKVQLLPASKRPEADSDISRRQYYLDWQHYYEMTEQLLDAHLTAFWRYVSKGLPIDNAADIETARDLLALPENFTLTQLKKSYRTLALQQHPDRGGDSQRFIVLSQAYQLLLTQF